MKFLNINISDLSLTQESELMDKLHEFFPLVAFDDDTIRVTENGMDEELTIELTPIEDYVVTKGLLHLRLQAGDLNPEELPEDSENMLNSKLKRKEVVAIDKLLEEEFEPKFNDSY